MELQFIRVGGRQLLATVHRPARLRPRGSAVLVCSPFGEEAARAHRSLRVLAQQLEAEGYCTMRFDYAGTGDSSGEVDAHGVDDWLDDIAACAEALRAISGAPRTTLVGLRLGASLAALAATRHALAARHLVLWEPVVDGARYLAALRARHHAYLVEELGRAPTQGGDELLGVPLTPALAAGLSRIDLAAQPPQAEQITVLRARDDDALARLRAARPEGPAVRWMEDPAADVWDSDAALNAAVVPAASIAAIVARVREVSP